MSAPLGVAPPSWRAVRGRSATGRRAPCTVPARYRPLHGGHERQRIGQLPLRARGNRCGYRPPVRVDEVRAQEDGRLLRHGHALYPREQPQERPAKAGLVPRAGEALDPSLPVSPVGGIERREPLEAAMHLVGVPASPVERLQPAEQHRVAELRDVHLVQERIGQVRALLLLVEKRQPRVVFVKRLRVVPDEGLELLLHGVGASRLLLEKDHQPPAQLDPYLGRELLVLSQGPLARAVQVLADHHRDDLGRARARGDVGEHHPPLERLRGPPVPLEVQPRPLVVQELLDGVERIVERHRRLQPQPVPARGVGEAPRLGR